jgi:anthranilate synthase component I
VPRFTCKLIDLDLPSFDPPAALEALLGLHGTGRGFLLEKNEGGRKQVFAAANPFEILRIRNGEALAERGDKTQALRGNAFEALGARLAQYRADNQPFPFSTGAAGYLAYETVGYIEKLPLKPRVGEDAALMLFDHMLVWDDAKKKAQLSVLLPKTKQAKALKAARVLAERLADAIRHQPRADFPGASARPAEMTGTLGRAKFLDGVRKVKKHIKAGDIFQGVLSEKFRAPFAAGPMRFYRAISKLEPSPYVFAFRDGPRTVAGASPERLIKAAEGIALNCPIAGTRKRGRTRAEDLRLEKNLKASPKERAEHLMLVDLARNDLGRVCVPGTVKVAELMKVRRFSNVMHLVSEVEGELKRPAWEALAASFPAGTVSGAPKIRAMEILAGLEPLPRGFYAGAFLQHDFAGNLDSCITIRSASFEDGQAELQAGAGIVADSNPAREYQEVLNKLATVRRALALAEA